MNGGTDINDETAAPKAASIKTSSRRSITMVSNSLVVLVEW